MESDFVLNPAEVALVDTEAPSKYLERLFPVRARWSAAEAVAASATGLHAAIADTGSSQTIQASAIAALPCARCVTATAGGTSGDIGAISPTIKGYDIAGNYITEVMPAFTANTAGSVSTTKAFAQVTEIVLPAHDGTGATTSFGWSDALGLLVKRDCNTVLAAYLNKVREGTAPTVAFSASSLANNTVDLNSALNGTPVEVHFMVP